MVLPMAPMTMLMIKSTPAVRYIKGKTLTIGKKARDSWIDATAKS